MAGKKDKIKDSERFSIITPTLDRCMVCGTDAGLHLHEVFGGPYRDISKQDGLVVSLCPDHHNMSAMGVHFNKELDTNLKKRAQIIWMEKYCDKNMSDEEKEEAFIDRYGRNYLLD